MKKIIKAIKQDELTQIAIAMLLLGFWLGMLFVAGLFAFYKH